MRKKALLISIFLLVGIFMGLSLITPVLAAPTDTYNVRAGDCWVIYFSKSSNPSLEGNYSKYEVTAVNESFISTYWLDAVWGSQYMANATNMTWALTTPEGSHMCYYNGTDVSFLTTTGGSGLWVWSTVYCTNQTALNTSFYNTMKIQYPNINNTNKNGLTFTYWNGKTDGTGVDNNSVKAVIVVDPTKYVLSSQKFYNWSTASQNWVLKDDSYLIAASWITTTLPPIPGFELMFIILVLGGMGTYFWRKNRINTK